MATFSLSAGCLTGSGFDRSQLPCAPARGSETLADFVSSNHSTISASDSAFHHDSLGKFSVTITTATQSYHRNQQYSIIAITDDSGDILERYSYSAYGVPTLFDGSGTLISGSAYGNRYTFTGREWDGVIGLYHYRARMYDPQLGRFLGRDPIGYKDGVSLYKNYFGLSNTDPSGKGCVICLRPVAILETFYEDDDPGRIAGCAVRFVMVPEHPRHGQPNPGFGNGRQCNGCEPVPTCDDLPPGMNLWDSEIIRVVEPVSGLFGDRCPSVSELDDVSCVGIAGKNCSTFEQTIEECFAACDLADRVQAVCGAIPNKVAKKLCELSVDASIELCRQYCRNSRLKLVDVNE